METLKRWGNHLPLRQFFVMTVLLTVCVVFVVSALVIWGCQAFREYLLPEPDSVYLTVDEILEGGIQRTSTYLIKLDDEEQALPYIEADGGSELLNAGYTIRRIDKSYDTLTPKRKLAYQICGAAMYIVPALLSISGIVVCGGYFYRRRLSEPIRILSTATEQIMSQNLDVSLAYDCEDEMGDLCRSFEQMRDALVDNYKTMWQLLEQRRLLQASIAHDLRNPIAIIEGYTEYLQVGIHNQTLTNEKIEHIVHNLNLTAKRLDHYTESVRTLNQLEDIEVRRKRIAVADLVANIQEDFALVAAAAGVQLEINSTLPDGDIQADMPLLYRVLENVIGNAVRYAMHEISVELGLNDNMLCITVSDDGKGFSELIMHKKGAMFMPVGEEGHLGMGLSISRLLCEKHGGSLDFYNSELHHAVVDITFAI